MKRITKTRRNIKRFLEYRSANLTFSLNNLLTIITVISALGFLITQLITNAILAPMGKKLASLNNERLYLQEYTRQMQEDIALSTSLNTREKLSEKKLNLKPNASKTIVFIETDTVIASKQ